MAEEPIKPGNKSSEHKMTYIAILISAVLGAVSDMALPEAHWAVKIALILSPILASFGYGNGRSKVKAAAALAGKGAKLLLCVMIPLMLMGCLGTKQGYINANNIEGGLTKVCDRHDALIDRLAAQDPFPEIDLDGDGKPDNKADLKTYKRSTKLLMRILENAIQKAKEEKEE